ncbi:hypothetical protein GPECTOR_70g479 [Gonium pectorale]|uniref:Uncharacterized protein n=1 Tax=Gonium pectorale TaxID=33097 RepID=A0A150G332_GONPE|nr:hypothetical protein GPECTOR_70g479 [Gonium pectorale]|eukprot:KXZ44248.1 hypothetical protein GPECTOR_70g479 [Gonium pectorale]
MWIPFDPDTHALEALSGLARREAVHHTGLGPLYGGVTGLLCAGALRPAVEALQQRLTAYLRETAAWAGQQGQRLELGLGLSAVSGEQPGKMGQGSTCQQQRPQQRQEQELGSGQGAGVESSDSDSWSSSGEDSEDEDASSDDGSSGGSDVTMANAGADPPLQPPRLLGQPGLHLGPAELMLLSIHPIITGAGPALLLEIPFKAYGREAAATTTALCVLLAALRRPAGSGGGEAADLEWLGLRFAPGEYLQVLSQGGATRLAPLHPLWGHVVAGLAQLVQARPSLRELHLSAPPGLLTPSALERLQRAAADPAPRSSRRMAVLMGGHRRLGASSPLRLLPTEVLELIMDAAIPRAPTRLVLGVQAWMPGGADNPAAPGGAGGQGNAPAQAGDGGGGGAAGPPWQQQQQQQPQQPMWAVWQAGGAAAGAPAAPAPDVQQPQQVQQAGQGFGGPGGGAQLPDDVRVAARHAAAHR